MPQPAVCPECKHDDTHAPGIGCLFDTDGDYCPCTATWQRPEPGTVPDLPLTPYAGTSGWSGSATSRERAERDDTDGTTKARQQSVLAALTAAGSHGLTWRELAVQRRWHHGQASGPLSVLHKAGTIARLAERRDRCAVYVLPENVLGRDVQPHGGKAKPRPSKREDVRTAVQEAVGAASVCWEGGTGDAVFDSARALKVADDLLAWLDKHL